MLRYIGLWLLAVCGCAAGWCAAEESADQDTAPGYQQCMDNAVSTMDINECSQLALKYWDEQLNYNYRLAMENCSAMGEENQELSVRCRTKLRDTHTAWLKYRELMAEYLAAANEGSMGSIVANGFMAEATRDQARRLQTE